MADTYAQTPIVGAAQLGVDVAQTVVTCVAPPELEFGLARQHIQFVVSDQDLLRLNLEKTRQCCDRLTRAVHECLRL